MSRNSSTDKGDREQRDAAPETRGDRGVSEDTQRADDGLISDEEFARLLDSDFDETALPKPPQLPGWHLCWLTTTSTYDTIQKRQRLGYQPVRMADFGDKFDPSNGKGLEAWPGYVTCNEMVLFKIPEARYQQLMTHYHHRKPLEEEAGIVAKIKAAANEEDSTGRKLAESEGDGIDQMEESVRRGERTVPTFAST
jgi:hypothetical protein